MTPAAIIEKATADGVNLTLSPAGTIKVAGDQAEVDRWLPIIRESKPAIVAMLTAAAKVATSWGWLLHYPDSDPVTVFTVPTSTHAGMLRDFPGAIAAEPFKPSFRQPTRPMTADQETTIRTWLAGIEETDSYIIADVLEQCRNDADARDYFIQPTDSQLNERK